MPVFSPEFKDSLPKTDWKGARRILYTAIASYVFFADVMHIQLIKAFDPFMVPITCVAIVLGFWQFFSKPHSL